MSAPLISTVPSIATVCHGGVVEKWGHKWRRGVTLLAAIAVVGCSSTPRATTSTTSPLAAPFCADARDGLSPAQLYAEVKDRWTPELFASQAYGWITSTCPDVLSEWSGFLAAHGVQVEG